MNTDFKKVFANNLKHLLALREMTQQELAGKVGVTTVSLSRYASGDRLPRLDTALKISNVLETDLLSLMDQTEGEGLTGNHYQMLAARTINNNLRRSEQGKHALHGMVGEIGELHSIYQKRYQGHEFDEEHAKKELGDLLWFVAEYCTAHGWNLESIMQMNIDKLKARYPEGFAADKSLHRKAGDI